MRACAAALALAGQSQARRVRAQVYSQLEDGSSQVVNTAWALIALISAGYHRRDRAPLAAAARALLRAQVPQG